MAILLGRDVSLWFSFQLSCCSP